MYLEIDEDFPTHPKTIRLGARLANPTAGFYMLRLWSWARKYQKDGDITSYEPAEIEQAAGWPSLDGRFYTAAVAAGFIDELREGQTVVRRTLHNWMKRTGGSVARAESEADRKKKLRAHKAKPRQCGGASLCEFCKAEGEAERQLDLGGGTAVAVAETDDGRGAAAAADSAHQDKTRQGQSRQDLDPDPPPLIYKPPDRADARSEDRADFGGLPPARAPRRLAAVAAVTLAFLSCFERYPRGDGKQRAAQVWQEIAGQHPGGEPALAREILARFDAGILLRHPYDGDPRYRPTFETFLAERRWEDPDPAPEKHAGPSYAKL